MKKWVKKKTAIYIVLMLFLFCVSGCASSTNSTNKSPYELFQWGTNPDDTADKLASMGIDYDYDLDLDLHKNALKTTIKYVESNFCGVANLSGVVRFDFGNEDALNEITIFITLGGNENVNKLVDALNKKFGTPTEYEDATVLGMRKVNMSWSNSNSKIEFQVLGSTGTLTLKPE